MASKYMSAAVSRADLQELKVDLKVSREEGLKSLAELIEVKLDRVLDKVGNVHTTILSHISEEATRDAIIANARQVEVANMVRVHDVLRVDVESLKKYRWTLVGALAVVIVFVEFAINFTGVFKH